MAWPPWGRAACRSLSCAARAAPQAAPSGAKEWTVPAQWSSGVGWGLKASSRRSSVVSRLQRAGDAAVFSDPPEVDREEHGDCQRQQDHVQNIEAEQRVLRHLDATE